MTWSDLRASARLELRSLGLVAGARRVELVVLSGVGRLTSSPRAPTPGSLSVLAHLPSYPPTVSAGAEQSARHILEWLGGRGHRVTALIGGPCVEGDRDGVVVERERSLRVTLHRYRSADVVLTQLATRNRAMRLSRVTGRPLVVFLRMGGVDPATMLGSPELTVFSSEWQHRTHSVPGPSTVLHPPVDPARYRTERGDRVTLVNLSELKGGHLLPLLADALPDHRFLGVLGGYADQLVPSPLPPNVEIRPGTPDIREVFRRTRVLLMPSRFETFGRLALEAAACGIPTIANPVEGLRESLGDAGIWARRDQVDEWVAELRRLDDETAYAEASARARAQADVWDAEPELAALEARLVALAARTGQRSPSADR